MSIINQLASQQGRADEVPNQQLACRLAETGDRAGVQEITANLWNPDPNIQSDCIKVLYEIGYIDPELIAAGWPEYLKLLHSRHNRLVWGAMIALTTIASLKAAELFPHREEIQRAVDQGSVITVDNGVKALALIAAQDTAYRDAIFPYLLEHLRTCRPKDVPQHCESIRVAVDSTNRDAFIQTLEQRLPDLSASQAARVRKVLRAVSVV